MSFSVSFKVDTIAPFRKEAKKLIKKYPSIKNELAELGSQLSNNPSIGTSLGNNCYKIRLAISSKGKGKSGGARVITHIYVTEDTVYLLTIYDKSDKENVSEKQLKALLKLIHWKSPISNGYGLFYETYKVFVRERTMKSEANPNSYVELEIIL